MSYTTNELALLDLIGNVNKIFYYVGEDGDLIDAFDVKQLDKAVASFKPVSYTHLTLPTKA